MTRIAFVASVLALALSATPVVAQAPAARPSNETSAAALRARGLDLGYNLDHAEALAAFEQAIAADPGDAASYRLAAATMWIGALVQQGAVTAEDFLGQAGSSRRRAPRTAEIEAAVERAIALAEPRTRPGSRGLAGPEASALYESGAAYSLLASYTATVGGTLQKSLTAARRAYRDHERVLALDPQRKDAGLVVGMYRYAVSVLPLWSRLLARIAGFDGGRERGLRLVEEAARHRSDVQPNALFALIVIYNREARYEDALRVIGQLQERYPRNRLLWLEAGSTALRAGRPAAARDALARGLAMLEADTRPRAYGELARWRYHLGVAHARLDQRQDAERELGAALAGESHDWVRGRTRLELGRLSDRAGDRKKAVQEYRLAAGLCDMGNDERCRDEARSLSRRESR